jgi:formylglycine-generating enzyme required for sulfatase activity/serine/threonine protein kinase
MPYHSTTMSSPASLFASWLAGRSSDEPVELEDLVRAHPEHEAELRELHEQWRRLETLRQRFGLSGSLAERLRAVHGSEVDPKVELADEASGDFTEELVGKLAERSPASTRYRREGELARGGMGAVLRVWDEDLRRRLAMKVLLDKGAAAGERPPSDKRPLARLLEEAQVTAQLDHPGIVPVHELGLGADGEVFFTMKLVKGKTLGAVFDELAAGEGGWTQARILGLLVKVCEAMTYAHAKGVIHRDLKPANVMVGKFGEVYVMDWGLAKILARADQKDVRVRSEPAFTSSEVRSDRRDRAGETPDSPLYTMDGDVVGTPAYMSPEQAMGRVSEMGPPSDVYALGAMLYHLLAGHMPYVPPGARLNNYAVWSHVQSGPAAPLHEVAPDAPGELTAICERAMAREAGERYADMSALAADLSAYVEGRVVQAYETGAWAEARKWVRRNNGLAASLAAAVLLLVVGLAAALYLRGEAQANFTLAETRREDLQRLNEDLQRLNEDLESERSNLAAEIESVKRLSALQDYEDLIARVDALWPAHPENIASYEIWLGEARALAADLPLHLEKLEDLRAGALPQSDEEAAAERRVHPDFPRLEVLPGLIVSRRAALLQRRDGVSAAGFEPEWSELPSDASAMNALAWPLVDPEREVFGREAEGLALAERALELAESAADDALVANLGDTLSRALFALGRDETAREASAMALEVAIDEQRSAYEKHLSDLDGWIEEAASEKGLARAAEELAALETKRTELEVRVSERRTWPFPETEEGREAHWWHANLSQLIESLEGLEDEATGLLSDAGDAVSPEHGWSVPRRLRFAERLRDELAAGGEWSERWTEASAAIREHSDYGGLALAPLVGLVPIGPDPASGLWEFWHVATGAEPARGEDGKLALTEETGVTLVLIPAGSFWMGASADPDAEHNHDPKALGNEGPVHEVELSAYFLSKYELTQGQWLRFTGRNPSYYQPPEDLAPSLLHPVEQVSWSDAMRELPRMGLVLPSEAQWENGCRAGTGTPWWTGAERESLPEQNAANLADQAAARAGATWTAIQDWPELDDGFAVHAPVGAYAANPRGLHEVHGNVWEWCEDVFDASFYGRSPRSDPVAPWEGADNRVTRGGRFNDTAANARSAVRAADAPSFAARSLGVRPARVISE